MIRKITRLLSRTALLLMLSFGATLLASAQNARKFIVSGTVKDKATGETLPGATVSFPQLPGIGVSVNTYGFYSISIPAGSYEMIVSFTGYLSDTIHIQANKNLQCHIALRTSSGALQEVKISSNRTKNGNILITPADVQRLNIQDIKNVPVLLGEKDVLKTIQLLPGIVAAGDGRTGFYVRGGGADQNLVLLDEATVYNAAHLLGFFSVFNSDAIKDIDIYKGGMPANYGGRLSSVADIHMLDGNNRKFGINGGIGLIASRLTVEGPIDSGKGSFIISGRRTYLDLFTGLASDTTVKNSKLYFYDFNAKVNYQFDPNNRLYLSGYFGQDYLDANQNGINYGNATATLRWNHLFSNRLFSNTSLIYSNFNFNVDIRPPADVQVASGIRDYQLKQDFTFYQDSRNKFNFGLQAIYHDAEPGNAVPLTSTSNFNRIDLQRKYSLESALYFSDEWSVTHKLKTTYGVRLSDLGVMGPGTFYTYDAEGDRATSARFASGQIAKNYLNIEPRLAVNYQLNDSSSVKLSYDRNVQNIHLLSNSSTTSPTSVYLPSSYNIRPEIADQLAAGYYRTFNNNLFEFSSEVYYKLLQNQIDYKNGANLIGNEDVESELLFGKGRAYGWETFIKKKRGKFTGWISYTLSRTEKKIDGINNDAYYPANQDQTHHLSVVGMYQAGKKWILSADFVYNTGNAVTWPQGKFLVDNAVVYDYGARNASRIPAYNRLDLSATLLVKKTHRIESSWNFSVYNVYGQANPYTITFQQDPKNPAQTQVLQTTLFKMVPSVTYNFKF